MPSQCCTTGRSPSPTTNRLPTTVQSVGDTQVSAVSSCTLPLSGAGAAVQLVPSHRTASRTPTARQNVAEVHDTSVTPRRGASSATRQAEPSQVCRTGRNALASLTLDPPAAQKSAAGQDKPLQSTLTSAGTSGALTALTPLADRRIRIDAR